MADAEFLADYAAGCSSVCQVAGTSLPNCKAHRATSSSVVLNPRRGLLPTARKRKLEAGAVPTTTTGIRQPLLNPPTGDDLQRATWGLSASAISGCGCPRQGDPDCFERAVFDQPGDLAPVPAVGKLLIGSWVSNTGDDRAADSAPMGVDTLLFCCWFVVMGLPFRLRLLGVSSGVIVSTVARANLRVCSRNLGGFLLR